MDSVNSDLIAELQKMREGFDKMKTETVIKQTPNYRKTVLGKCPVFQERVPRDLRHPIISQCQRSQGSCLQRNNEGWC